MLRRRMPPPLRPFASEVVGYAEHGAPLGPGREPASLDVPVVITLAGGFRIAFDRPPAAADRAASFAAGLHPGFVDIASDGAAACVQINFTPLGARLALGLPMHALASRLVPLGDLPDTGLGELADRLADLPAWPDRLALAEAWAAGRIRAGLDAQGPEPRAVTAAYHLLRLSGGAPRIASSPPASAGAASGSSPASARRSACRRRRSPASCASGRPCASPAPARPTGPTSPPPATTATRRTSSASSAPSPAPPPPPGPPAAPERREGNKSSRPRRPPGATPGMQRNQEYPA